MSGFQGQRKVMSSTQWLSPSSQTGGDRKGTDDASSARNGSQYINTYNQDPLMNALYQNPKSIASSSSTLIDEAYSETQAQQALGHEIPLTVPTKSKHLHRITFPHSCTIRHRDIQTQEDLFTVYNVSSNYWLAIEQHTLSLVDSDLKVCAYFSPIDHIRKMLYNNPDIRDNLPDPVKETLETALDYSEFCSFEAISTHDASSTVFLSIGTVVLCYRLAFSHVVTDKKTHYVSLQEDEVSDVSSDVVLSSLTTTGVMTVESPPPHFNSYNESDQYIYKTLEDLYRYTRKHAYQPNIKRKVDASKPSPLSSATTTSPTGSGDDNVVFIGGLWSLQFVTAIDTAKHDIPPLHATNALPAQIIDIHSHNVYAYCQSDSKPNHLEHALVVPMVLVVTPLHIISYTLYNHVLLLQYIIPCLLSPPRVEQLEKLRTRTLALTLSLNQSRRHGRGQQHSDASRSSGQHGQEGSRGSASEQHPARKDVFGYSIRGGDGKVHRPHQQEQEQQRHTETSEYDTESVPSTPLFLFQYPTKVQSTLSPSGLWLAIATLHVVFMVKIPHKFIYTYASTSAYLSTHRFSILPAMVSTLALKSHVASVKFNPSPRLFDDLIMVLCEDGDLLLFTQDRDKYSSAYQPSPIAGRGIGNTMHSFSFDSIRSGLDHHHHELNLNPVSCVVGPYLGYQTLQLQQHHTHLFDPQYIDDTMHSLDQPHDAQALLTSPYPIPSSTTSSISSTTHPQHPSPQSTTPARNGRPRHPILVLIQHDLDAVAYYLNFYAIDNLTDIHDFSTNTSATSGVGSSRRCVGVSFPWVTLHHQSSTVSTDMTLITENNKNATRYLATHNHITRLHDDDHRESSVEQLLHNIRPTDVKAIVQHSKKYRGALYDAIEGRNENEQLQHQQAFHPCPNTHLEMHTSSSSPPGGGQAGVRPLPQTQPLGTLTLGTNASTDQEESDSDCLHHGTNLGNLKLSIDGGQSQTPITPSITTPSEWNPSSSASTPHTPQSTYHERARRQQQLKHHYHQQQQKQSAEGSTFVSATWVLDTPYHRNHEHSTKPPTPPGPHYVRLHPETTPILPASTVAGILRSLCGRSNVKLLLTTLGCYGNSSLFANNTAFADSFKSNKEKLEDQTRDILNSSYFTNKYETPAQTGGMGMEYHSVFNKAAGITKGGKPGPQPGPSRTRQQAASQPQGTELEALDDMVSIIALIPLLVQQSYNIDDTILQTLALHVADSLTKDPNVDYVDWVATWIDQITKEINNLGNHQLLHVDQKIRQFVKDNDEYDQLAKQSSSTSSSHDGADHGAGDQAVDQSRLNELERKILHMDENEYVIGIEFNSIIALNIIRSIGQLLLLTTIDHNHIYQSGTIFGTSSYWPVGRNNANITNILDVHNDMVDCAEAIASANHLKYANHPILHHTTTRPSYDVTLVPIESIIPMQMFYDESTSHIYQLFSELLESISEARHTTDIFSPLLSQQQDLARTSYSVLPYINERIFKNFSYPASNYVSVDCNGSLTFYHLKHLHSFKEYPYFEQYHQSQQQLTMSQQQYGNSDPDTAYGQPAQQQLLRVATNYQHVKMCTYGSRCESLSLFTINKMQNAADCIDLYVVDSNFLSVLDGYNDGICDLYGDENSASIRISAIVLARPISLLLFLQSRTGILQKVSATKLYHHTNPGAIDGVLTGTMNSNVRIEGQLVSCSGGVSLKPTQNMIPIGLFSRIVPSQPFKISLTKQMGCSTMTSVLFYQVDYTMQRLFRLLNNKELKQPLTTQDNFTIHSHHPYALLLVDGAVTVIFSQTTNLAKHSLASNAQVHSQIHPYPRHNGVEHLYYDVDAISNNMGLPNDPSSQDPTGNDHNPFRSPVSYDSTSPISPHRLSHVSGISTVYDDRMLLSCLSYIFVDDTNYTAQFYKGFRASYHSHAFHNRISDNVYPSLSHQIATKLKRNDPLKYLIYRKILNIFPCFDYGAIPLHHSPTTPLTLSSAHPRLPTEQDLLNRTIFEYTGCSWISTTDISVLTVALSAYVIFWNATPIASDIFCSSGQQPQQHGGATLNPPDTHVYHLVLQPIIEIKTCNFGLKQTHWTVSTRFCSGSPVAFDPLAVFTSHPSSIVELLSPVKSTGLSSSSSLPPQHPDSTRSTLSTIHATTASEVSEGDGQMDLFPPLPIPTTTRHDDDAAQHQAHSNSIVDYHLRSITHNGVTDITREISIMQLFINNLMHRCTPIMLASCTTNDQNTVNFNNDLDALARAFYDEEDIMIDNTIVNPRDRYERTHLIVAYDMEIINYYLSVIHHNGLNIRPSAGTIHSAINDAAAVFAGADHRIVSQDSYQGTQQEDYAKDLLKRQQSLLPTHSFVALPHLNKTQKELLKQQVHRHRVTSDTRNGSQAGQTPGGAGGTASSSSPSTLITTTVSYVEYSRISTQQFSQQSQSQPQPQPQPQQPQQRTSSNLRISSCALVGRRDTPSPFNIYYAPCFDYHVVIGDSLGHVHLIPLTDFITSSGHSNTSSSPSATGYLHHGGDGGSATSTLSPTESAAPPTDRSTAVGTGSSVDSVIDRSYLTANSIKFIAYHHTPVLFLHSVSLTTIITIARNIHSTSDLDYYQFTIWKSSHVGYGSKFTCTLHKSTYLHSCAVVKSYNGLSNVVIPGVNGHQITVLTETPSTTYEVCTYLTLGHIGCVVQSVLPSHHGHLFVLCRLGLTLSMKTVSSELISLAQLNMFNEIIKRQQESQSMQLQQSQNYLALLNTEQARVDDDLTLRVNNTTLSSARPLPVYHPVSLIEDIRSGAIFKARNILAHLHVQLLDLFDQVYQSATKCGMMPTQDGSADGIATGDPASFADPLASALCPPHLISQIDPSLTTAINIHNQHYQPHHCSNHKDGDNDDEDGGQGGASGSSRGYKGSSNKRLRDPRPLPRVTLSDHSLGLPPTDYLIGGFVRSNHVISSSGDVKDIYDGFPHDVMLPLYDDIKHATRLRFTALKDLYDEEEMERVRVDSHSAPHYSHSTLTTSSGSMQTAVATSPQHSIAYQPPVSAKPKTARSAFDSSSSDDDDGIVVNTVTQPTPPPVVTRQQPPKVKSAFDSSSSDDDIPQQPAPQPQPQPQQPQRQHVPTIKSAFDSSSSDEDLRPVQPVPPVVPHQQKVRSAFDSSSSDDEPTTQPRPPTTPALQPPAPKVRSAFDSSSSDSDTAPQPAPQPTPHQQKPQQPQHAPPPPRPQPDHHTLIEELRNRIRSIRKPFPIYVDVDVLEYTPLHALELVQMLTGQAITYQAIISDMQSTGLENKLSAGRFKAGGADTGNTAKTVLEKVSEGFFTVTSGSLLANVIDLPGLTSDDVRSLVCLVIAFTLTSYLDVYMNCVLTPRAINNLDGNNYTNTLTPPSSSSSSLSQSHQVLPLTQASPGGGQNVSEWIFETHQNLSRAVLEDGQVDACGWRHILLATTTLLMQTEAFKHKNLVNKVTNLVSHRKITGYSSNASNLAEKTRTIVSAKQHLVMPYDLTESVQHVYRTINNYTSEQQASQYLRLCATEKSFDLSTRREQQPFDAFIDLPDCTMYSLPITSVVYGLHSLTKPELIAHLLTVASAILRTTSNAIHLVNNVDPTKVQLPSTTITVEGDKQSGGAPIVKDKPGPQLFVEYMQFFSRLRPDPCDDDVLTSSISPLSVLSRLAVADGQPIIPSEPMIEPSPTARRRKSITLPGSHSERTSGVISSLGASGHGDGGIRHTQQVYEQSTVKSLITANITPDSTPTRQPTQPTTTDIFSISWPLYSSLGIGYLLSHHDIPNDVATLHAQLLSSSSFAKTNSSAESLLWLVATNKISELLSLLKADPSMINAYNFLKRDFSIKENQLKAVENGFSALQRQKYHTATAFFLLGQRYNDAIKCLVRNAKDIQLALFIAKLLHGRGITATVDDEDGRYTSPYTHFAAQYYRTTLTRYHKVFNPKDKHNQYDIPHRGASGTGTGAGIDVGASADMKKPITISIFQYAIIEEILPFCYRNNLHWVVHMCYLYLNHIPAALASLLMLDSNFYRAFYQQRFHILTPNERREDGSTVFSIHEVFKRFKAHDLSCGHYIISLISSSTVDMTDFQSAFVLLDRVFSCSALQSLFDLSTRTIARPPRRLRLTSRVEHIDLGILLFQHILFSSAQNYSIRRLPFHAFSLLHNIQLGEIVLDATRTAEYHLQLFAFDFSQYPRHCLLDLEEEYEDIIESKERYSAYQSNLQRLHQQKQSGQLLTASGSVPNDHTAGSSQRPAPAVCIHSPDEMDGHILRLSPYMYVYNHYTMPNIFTSDELYHTPSTAGKSPQLITVSGCRPLSVVHRNHNIYYLNYVTTVVHQILALAAVAKPHYVARSGHGNTGSISSKVVISHLINKNGHHYHTNTSNVSQWLRLLSNKTPLLYDTLLFATQMQQISCKHIQSLVYGAAESRRSILSLIWLLTAEVDSLAKCSSSLTCVNAIIQAHVDTSTSIGAYLLDISTLCTSIFKALHSRHSIHGGLDNASSAGDHLSSEMTALSITQRVISLVPPEYRSLLPLLFVLHEISTTLTAVITNRTLTHFPALLGLLPLSVPSNANAPPQQQQQQSPDGSTASQKDQFIHLLSSPSLLTTLTYKHRDVGVAQSELDTSLSGARPFTPSTSANATNFDFAKHYEFIKSTLPSDKHKPSKTSARGTKLSQCAAKFISVQHFLTSHSTSIKKLLTQPRTIVIVHALKHTQSLLTALIFIRFCEYKCRSLYMNAGYYSPKRLITPSILSPKIVFTDPTVNHSSSSSTSSSSALSSSPQHVKLTRYVREGVSRSVSYCLRSLKYCVGHLVRHVRTSLSQSLHLLQLQKQYAQLQRFLPRDTGDVDYVLYRSIAIRATNHFDNHNARRIVQALKGYNALNVKEYDRSIYDAATDGGKLFETQQYDELAKMLNLPSSRQQQQQKQQPMSTSSTSSWGTPSAGGTSSLLLAGATGPLRPRTNDATSNGYESNFGFFPTTQNQQSARSSGEKYYPASSVESSLIAMGVRLEKNKDSKKTRGRRNSFAQDLTTTAPRHLRQPHRMDTTTGTARRSLPSNLSGMLSSRHAPGLVDATLMDDSHGSHLLPSLESDGMLTIPISGTLPVTADLNSMAHSHSITFTLQATSHTLNSASTTQSIYAQHDKAQRRFYYHHLATDGLSDSNTTGDDVENNPLSLPANANSPPTSHRPDLSLPPPTPPPYISPLATLSYSIPKVHHNSVVASHKITTNSPHSLHQKFTTTTPSLLHLMVILRVASLSGNLPTSVKLTHEQRERLAAIEKQRQQQQLQEENRSANSKKHSKMATLKAAFTTTSVPTSALNASSFSQPLPQQQQGDAGAQTMLPAQQKYMVLPNPRQAENQRRMGAMDRQSFLTYIRKGFASTQHPTSITPYPIHNILLTLVYMHCFPAWESASSPSSLGNIAITAAFFSQLISSFDNIVNAMSSSPLHLTGFKIYNDPSLLSQGSSADSVHGSNPNTTSANNSVSLVSDAPPTVHGFFEIIHTLVRRVSSSTYGSNVFYFSSILGLSKALKSNMTHYQLVKLLNPNILTPQPFTTLSNPILEDLNNSVIPWELLYAYHTHNTIIRSFSSSSRLKSLVRAMLVPALISSLQVIANYVAVDLSEHIYRAIPLAQHENHSRKRIDGVAVVLNDMSAQGQSATASTTALGGAGSQPPPLAPHLSSTSLSSHLSTNSTASATVSSSGGGGYAHSHGTSPTTVAATEIEHAISHALGHHSSLDDLTCYDEFYNLAEFRDITCSATCNFDPKYVIIGTSKGIKEIYIPTLLQQIQLSQHAEERRNMIYASVRGHTSAGTSTTASSGVSTSRSHTPIPSSTAATPLSPRFASSQQQQQQHSNGGAAELATTQSVDEANDELNHSNPFKKRLNAFYLSENGAVVKGNIVSDIVTSLDQRFLLSAKGNRKTVDFGQPGMATSIPPLFNIVNPVYHLGANVTAQLSLVNSPHLPFVYSSSVLSFISHIHLCSRRVIDQYLQTKPASSHLNWLYTAALTAHLRTRPVDHILAHPSLPFYCTAQGDLILFWHLHIPIPFAQMQTHQNVAISSLAFTPDGNTLIATTQGGRMYIYQHYGCFYPANTKVNQSWGMHIHTPSVSLQPYDCPSRAIATAHNTIITVSTTGVLKVWQIQVPLCVCIATKVLPSAVTCISYIPNYRWLVCGTVNGLVYLVETQSLSMRQTLHLNGLHVNNKNLYLMVTDAIADGCKGLISTLLSQQGHEVDKQYVILDTGRTVVDQPDEDVPGSGGDITIHSSLNNSRSRSRLDEPRNTPSLSGKPSSVSEQMSTRGGEVTTTTATTTTTSSSKGPDGSSVVNDFYRPPIRTETTVDSTYVYKSFTTYTYYDTASLASPSPPQGDSAGRTTPGGLNPAAGHDTQPPSTPTGVSITKIVYNPHNNTLLIGDAVGYIHVYCIQSTPLPLLSTPPIRSHISTTSTSTTYPYYTDKEHQMNYQYNHTTHASSRSGDASRFHPGVVIGSIPKQKDHLLYGSSTITQSSSKFTMSLPISFGYGLKFVRLLSPNVRSSQTMYGLNTTEVNNSYIDALTAATTTTTSALSFFRSDKSEKQQKGRLTNTEFSCAFCDGMAVVLSNTKDGKCNIILESVPFQKML